MGVGLDPLIQIPTSTNAVFIFHNLHRHRTCTFRTSPSYSSNVSLPANSAARFRSNSHRRYRPAIGLLFSSSDARMHASDFETRRCTASLNRASASRSSAESSIAGRCLIACTCAHYLLIPNHLDTYASALELHTFFT